MIVRNRHCPACGAIAAGTRELLPGIALLVFSDEGKADWQGSTNIAWDEQKTVCDDQGRALLACGACDATWSVDGALPPE